MDIQKFLKNPNYPGQFDINSTELKNYATGLPYTIKQVNSTASKNSESHW